MRKICTYIYLVLGYIYITMFFMYYLPMYTNAIWNVAVTAITAVLYVIYVCVNHKLKDVIPESRSIMIELLLGFVLVSCLLVYCSREYQYHG